MAGERLNRLVWNLGWMLSYIGDGSGPRRVQSACDMARAAPTAFELWFGKTRAEVDGLYMFWDLARNFREDRPRALHEAMFEALSEQLRSDNAWIQQSALHGLGHLKDARSQPLIERFISRCPPGHLRDYAEMANRFEVL